MGDLDVTALLIGSAIGAAATLLLQFFNWLLGHARDRRFLRISLALLNRHILASIKSLSATTPYMPVYTQIARVKFCKVSSELLPSDLVRLGVLTRTNERARILLTAVRNSDIFLEEIAQRLEGQSFEERAKSLADARGNMIILGKFVENLGLSTQASTVDAKAEVGARSVLDADRTR